MTRVRIVGDIHGKLEAFESLYKGFDGKVIQVGDFGIGFRGPAFNPNLPENVTFIRGNHDNPALSAVHTNWIPDGTYNSELDAMFIGGAWSIDKSYRTPGFDWWPEEEIGAVEFSRIVQFSQEKMPSVMITHETPLSASKSMFFDSGIIKGTRTLNQTASYLEEIFSHVKPRLWIHGHWHYNVESVINGTRFICLNELSYIDFDVVNGEWALVDESRPGLINIGSLEI